MGNTSIKSRDVNSAYRVQLACKLRAAKVPWHVVAQQCGYANKGAARNAVMRELERVVVEDVQELRREEVFMLDQIHTECWALFMDKQNKARLFAADRLLSTSEARRKLMGLDLHPEEEIASQNYTKKIVLTHQNEEASDASND